MTLLVKRSAPLKTIMMSPTGKKMAEMVRISPGALSWYQGAASVDSITAQLLLLSAEWSRLHCYKNWASKVILQARYM